MCCSWVGSRPGVGDVPLVACQIPKMTALLFFHYRQNKSFSILKLLEMGTLRL